LKLTPLDIKKQEFKKAVRGYDRVEVETFLEMVADHFESLIREKNELADEVLRLKTQLRDYQDVEQTLKDTLMRAQQNIDDSRENSRREAEMIIRDAEMKAEKILEEAKLKLAELKNELIVVRAQKDSFARRLRHLLVSQLDLLEVLDLDDLGFEKLGSRKGRRSKSAKKQQAEIEFEGVDEVFPEPSETADAKEPARTERPEPAVHWEGNVPESGAEDKPEGQEKKTRISDKLIY